MSRIILSEYQRQILAFEYDSVLPSCKITNKYEAYSIQNKVPFEYATQATKEDYYKEIKRFFEEFSQENLCDLDFKAISEIRNDCRGGEKTLNRHRFIMPKNITTIVTNKFSHSDN